MVEIVPAVLAETPQHYQHDLEIATSVSDRIQVDLVDGEFAGNRTINVVQAHWPDTVRADLHLMHHDPYEHTSTLIAQQPHVAIVHAEARELSSSRLDDMRRRLQESGIKFGIALLPETPVTDIERRLEEIDHVLVFTGELGHYGGQLRSDCLSKISRVKRINPAMEVGVDGGITEETAASAIHAGADVLNVGGFIQNATHPQKAYATLEKIINDQHETH